MGKVSKVNTFLLGFCLTILRNFSVLECFQNTVSNLFFFSFLQKYFPNSTCSLFFLFSLGQEVRDYVVFFFE